MRRADEDGEDDWCWEEEFEGELADTTKVREQNTARETMYLVASPWEDGWEHWKPYRELRLNWVWSGIDEGWQQNASEVWQLAYDVKAKGKKAEELEDDDLLTDHERKKREREEAGGGGRRRRRRRRGRGRGRGDGGGGAG